jgi:hypothetical protein
VRSIILKHSSCKEIIMKWAICVVGAMGLLAFGVVNEASARGFGAARGGFAVGPRGGVAANRSFGGVAAGPFGGVHAGGAQGFTRVTPGGTTIQGGRAGGVGVGPLGGVHAGGAQGVRVTTPGGRTFSSGSAGGVGVGPLGGVRAGGVGGTAVGGPWGGAAVGRAGGVRVGGVGHMTNYISPNALSTRAGYVRTGYRYPYFTPTWYRSHTAAWVAPRWRVANYWAAPAWTAVGPWCGITAAPVYYDYGSNVVINNDQVYYNGDPVSTAEDYAQQATSYADAGRQAKVADNEEWQPLGVFGMVQGDEEVAQRIFQLGINKAGIIRGNYYDAVADNTLPVYGSVDPRTQRAAWSIGDKKNIVFETGLNNLTKDQTTVLVHYGTEQTQQAELVRLPDPDSQK